MGILSLAAVFLVRSPVTLLLLPAAVALVVAAVRSLGGAGRQVIWAPLALVPGLLGVAAMGFGLYALFQLGDDETRCWALVQVEGREEWQSMEVPPRTETGGMKMGPFGPGVKKAICSGSGD